MNNAYNFNLYSVYKRQLLIKATFSGSLEWHIQSSHLTFYLTGPNLKTALMTINSNHQNSKHDDVPNIIWTCQLCIREDQNASKKTKTLYFGSMFILIS
jgi:hypothetical protein